VRPVLAFLPRDLVEVVERRAAADDVSLSEALGRLVAETVPRMLAETLERIAIGMRTTERRADETLDAVASGSRLAARAVSTPNAVTARKLNASGPPNNDQRQSVNDKRTRSVG
jgi:hypothetical protein